MTACVFTTTGAAKGAALGFPNMWAVDGLDYEASVVALTEYVNDRLPQCGTLHQGLSEIHACLNHAGEVEDWLDGLQVDVRSLDNVAAQIALAFGEEAPYVWQEETEVSGGSAVWGRRAE